MARYKVIDTSPRFLAVDLEKQLLPGSFEHAVHHLLDHEFDLSLFDSRYRNDQIGATAYPPGMLLKLILCACAANTSLSLPYPAIPLRISRRLPLSFPTLTRKWPSSLPRFSTSATGKD